MPDGKSDVLPGHKGYSVTKPIEEWAEQAESRIVAKLSPQGERDTLLLMTTLLRLNEWKLMAARSSHREQQRR
jgi:hypothetical protein